MFWWRLSQSSTGSWKFRCAFLLLRAPPAGKLSLKSWRHSVARVNVSVTRVLHLGCCERRHCQTTLAIDGSGWTREAGESSGEDETAVTGTKTKMGTKCCSWMMQEKKKKEGGTSWKFQHGTVWDQIWFGAQNSCGFIAEFIWVQISATVLGASKGPVQFEWNSVECLELSHQVQWLRGSAAASSVASCVVGRVMVYSSVCASVLQLAVVSLNGVGDQR